MGKATKHFNTEELVSKEVYELLGDMAIKLIDPTALEVLENVREILDVPLICNNWHDGGTRDECGFRAQGTSVGAKYSQHRVGMAFDLVSPRMTAKEMRDKLDENKDLLTHPIRVEKWQGKKDEDHEISWLHIDVGDTKGEKIYWFLA